MLHVNMHALPCCAVLLCAVWCHGTCRNPSRDKLESVLADSFQMGEEGYQRKFSKAGVLASYLLEVCGAQPFAMYTSLACDAAAGRVTCVPVLFSASTHNSAMWQPHRETASQAVTALCLFTKS